MEFVKCNVVEDREMAEILEQEDSDLAVITLHIAFELEKINKGYRKKKLQSNETP